MLQGAQQTIKVGAQNIPRLYSLIFGEFWDSRNLEDTRDRKSVSEIRKIIILRPERRLIYIFGLASPSVRSWLRLWSL